MAINDKAFSSLTAKGRVLLQNNRSKMRIVGWNIRAGGGRRVIPIADQLKKWQADVIVLCEYRATPPSLALAEELAEYGLVYQRTTARSEEPKLNCLLVASRWPLRRVHVRAGPLEPGRWLLVRVNAPKPITVGAMHVPNRVSGRKYPFLDAILEVARCWRGGPAIFLGDTNSGCRGIDEEVPAFNLREDRWMQSLSELCWVDAFRHLHGNERVYTWYSPNGRNGFRLDQAFVNRNLLTGLSDARYDWGHRLKNDGESKLLSDHAALLVELRNSAS
jgi:exonuclease III